MSETDRLSSHLRHYAGQLSERQIEFTSTPLCRTVELRLCPNGWRGESSVILVRTLHINLCLATYTVSYNDDKQTWVPTSPQRPSWPQRASHCLEESMQGTGFYVASVTFAKRLRTTTLALDAPNAQPLYQCHYTRDISALTESSKSRVAHYARYCTTLFQHLDFLNQLACT